MHTRKNFPIKIETGENTVVDPTIGSYKQYIVAANGFVIAHFSDPTSMQSYIKYLDVNGFGQFPARIMDVLFAQSEKVFTKDLKKLD